MAKKTRSLRRQHFRGDGELKRGYASFDDADAVARAIIERSPSRTMQAYLCEWCNEYHVGNHSDAWLRVGQVEVGMRVMRSMRQENRQRESQKRKYVIRKANAAATKRGDDGEGTRGSEGSGVQPALAEAS